MKQQEFQGIKSATQDVPRREEAPARLRRPERNQIEFRSMTLDSLLPEDHPARLVWEYVSHLDLTDLVYKVLSVEERPGRPAADPRILLTLWLLATLQGVGSARELDRLCREHAAYQWICGGVSMNYHSLSDFRTRHVEFLDDLLTRSVAVLMAEGLVTLNRVAQDGVRVRASAGGSSFRRRPSLNRCLKEARRQVRRLREELDCDPGSGSRREKAARMRAAEERRDRIRRAVDRLPEVEKRRKSKDKTATRVSTTDPEAQVMKMSDGGFRPAFNVQFAADTGSQVVMGVSVGNIGSDRGEMGRMVDQLEKRYGSVPKEILVDGGFAKNEDIERLGGSTTVYAPVQKPKDLDRDPHTPHPKDSPILAEWRVRMGTPEAKDIYQQRASTAECVNAIARNRGLRQFRVRGMTTVLAVVLFYALAHNVMRTIALRAEWRQ